MGNDSNGKHPQLDDQRSVASPTTKSFDNLLHTLIDDKQRQHSHPPLELGSLRGGAEWEGTQCSESGPPSYQIAPGGPVGPINLCVVEPSRAYTVHVSLKYVDLAQDYLCGYLTIDDLTEQFPQLTTYFDGDVVSGPAGRHSFATHRWGADEGVDGEHWRKFAPFMERMDSEECGAVREMDKYFAVTEDDVREKRKRYLFMRWKELFLVPDHLVRSIQGASYDGFYYIMYDTESDTLEGYYYHDSTDRNQHLQLKPKQRKRSGSFDFN